MSSIIALAAVTVILGFGLAWFLIPFAMRKQAERKLDRVCRANRTIVLTFDDGPGPVLTPQLLDLLQQANIRATFYALGRNAETRPDLVRRAIAEGHDVGSHTFNHANAWKSLPWTAARDVIAGIETVTALGGQARAFRPPYGKLTLAGLMQGSRLGLHYGWWTVDTRDSWAPRAIDDVIAEVDSRGGGVMLMHDFDSYEKVSSTTAHVDYVLDTTSRLIALAQKRGFTIVPLSELDRLAAVTPTP
jgi:peptidoglycan/xylan/chitin deacetylase (PgdA/CDA1 family)